MFKIITTTIAFLLGLIAFGQVSENRTVAEFSKLKASHDIEVFYTVSTTCIVTGKQIGRAHV